MTFGDRHRRAAERKHAHAIAVSQSARMLPMTTEARRESLLQAHSRKSSRASLIRSRLMMVIAELTPQNVDAIESRRQAISRARRMATTDRFDMVAQIPMPSGISLKIPRILKRSHALSRCGEYLSDLIFSLLRSSALVTDQLVEASTTKKHVAHVVSV
jgi:hypothetical protein